MFVEENSTSIHLQGMRDRIMWSGTKFAREIQLTDWSTAGNLSNRPSGVQIPRDICTRFGRYLYSTRCSWIIIGHIRIPGSGLELRSTLQVRLLRVSLFKCKLHSTLFNDIPPHKPPLRASSIPIPGIRIWPIGSNAVYPRSLTRVIRIFTS